jgi:eukaryotic-like serine/threonine-protein kinase
MRKTLLWWIAVFGLVSSAVYAQDATPEPTADLSGAEPLYEFTRVRWQREIGPASLGNPLLANGTLYAGNQRGVLFALDAETGESRWTHDGFGGHVAEVTVAGGVVYAAGMSAEVRALTESDGSLLWSIPLNDAVYGAPLLVDHGLYLTTASGMVYAVDLESHEIIWSANHGERGIAAPVFDAGRIYASLPPNLVALDAQSGDLLWEVESSAGYFAFPAAANGMVYAGSGDRRLYAFNAETGEIAWSFEAQGDAWSTPLVTDDTLYIGNSDHYLYALDSATGRQRWRFETDDWAVSDPTLAGDVLYVGVGNHENREGRRPIYALNATTGEELWRFTAQTRILTAAAVGDQVIFVLTIGGQVYALE